MITVKPEISRRSLRLSLALGFALCAGLITSASASAAPALEVDTVWTDHVTAGKKFRMVLNVQNVGDEPFAGALTIKTTFPAGIVAAGWAAVEGGPGLPSCQVLGQETECSDDLTGFPAGSQVRYQVESFVEPSAAGALPGGEIEVSGGGAAGSFTEAFDFLAGTPAPFAIKNFSIGIADAPTLPAAQAGADPSEFATAFTLSAEWRSTGDQQENPNAVMIAPPETFRDVIAHVPPGFVGNPTSTPVRCTQAQLTELSTAGSGIWIVPNCPAASQIGLAQVNTGDIIGVFNIVPPPGYPAAFGFYYAGVLVTLFPEIRPSDHGIDVVAEKAVNSIPLPRTEVTLWGIPSDPSHDALRGVCLHGGYGFNSQSSEAVDGCPLESRSGTAFLRNPTSCPGTPLPWGIEMNSYEHPEKFIGATDATDAMVGCDQVPFDPEIAMAPSERSAHSPSGLDVRLSMPQNTDPEGIAQSDLRAATVTLPEGVAINPASADGLAACTDAQLRLGLEGPSQCPEASKLGSIELITPLLDEQIGGSVYLRTQASGDPASGELYRLAIELRSAERGIAIKLPGSLRADPRTGQLTTTFSDLPQLPFESMQLHFKTGPRAPLTTPKTCATYTAHTTLTSWSGKTVELDPSFTIDQNCTPPPFKPGFQAGVSDPAAGRFAPFSLRVTREDGQPNIARIDVTLPEGELASLAGVGVCPESGAATGDCPASSLLGSATAGVGAGTNPLYLPQPGRSPTLAYLAGPYKGAQDSLLVKVPAQAGPFDLGTVTVRSPIMVDPTTTQVTVYSDPLPQIVGGVPVSYRDVRVKIDRPGFTLNPTSCEPMAVTGMIASSEGQSAAVSDRFQASDCAALGFKPKLALRLEGEAKRAGHPALTATLRMPRKGANIDHVSVALPHSEFLAQSHIRTICTRVQYTAGGGGGKSCPKGSVYGRATAWTPLLDEPLSGPVYLRSSSHALPDLVVSLDGQIHVDLVGRIDSKDGGIRTTFATVPDAPVSKFVLRMPGGRKSLLENSTNICRGTHRAVAKFDGQNGKIRDFNPVLKADCGKGGRGGSRSGGQR